MQPNEMKNEMLRKQFTMELIASSVHPNFAHKVSILNELLGRLAK